MITKPFLRFRKRSAFLSLVSILLFSVGVRAQEPGDYTYEVVNETTVTITGYTGPGGAITIPSVIDGLPVTAIGDNAFSDVTSLVEVKIPDSVEVIGSWAFGYCFGLRLVELGTGVSQILHGAFAEDPLLRVLFKGNAPTLEGYAFGEEGTQRGFSLYYEAGATGFNSPEWEGYPCAQWDAASFQPWVYEVVNDEVVLYDYAGLAHDLTTPATIEGKPVTSIGPGAFNSHSGLTGTFTIGNSVTGIGFYSFLNCDGLSEIVIPASVTYMVGNFARACDQLTAISVNPANPNYQSVDGVLFQLGQTELLTCPAGLSGLYSVPEGVTRVLGGSFEGCNALTALHLSSTVADFQAVPVIYWTGKVSSLQTITVDASNPNYSASDGMLLSKDGKTLVACPPGKTGNLVIPEGVTAIGASAFSGGSGLDGTLTLPSTLQIIESNAFRDCSGLTGGLAIPEGVTSIGFSAFYGCSGLDGTLTLPSTLPTIESYAFDGCSGLTGALVIPEGVTSIGESAFYGCSGLDGTLTLPSTLQIIESYAFRDCSGLTGGLVIPEGVTSIGFSAFYGCSGLDGTLTLPSTLPTIGSYAFRDCSGLTGGLVIPEGVTSVGSSAFYGCIGLDGTLTLPSTLASIGYSVFYGCSGLTGNLVIPEGVTSIGDSAFSGCGGLSSVTFMGDAPTTMGSDVFADMSNDLIIYYQPGASGFDASEWQGIDLEMIPNRAPRFRMIGNQTIKAGETITFEVIADDEDAGDVLEYSATKP